VFDHAAAMKRIEAGWCPCPGCSGGLTDPKFSPGGWGHCRSCRCAWKVQPTDKHACAVTIPGEAHAARSN